MAAGRPKVRNTVVRNVCGDLRKAGVNIEPLLEASGLARHMLKDDDGWLAYESHARFLENAAHVLKDPYYGLNLASRVEPREFGALAYIGLSSRTLGDALRNLERYLSIHTEAYRIRLLFDAEKAIIAIRPTRPDYSSYAQAAETGVGILVRAYQYFLGYPLHPLEVAFAHDLAQDRSRSQIERMLGCPVAFSSAQAQIALERDALSQRIGTADDHLLKILKEHCSSVLKQQKSDQTTLAARVSHAVADLLPSGRARAKFVAQELGMTERTLHRRLAQESTSFGEIHERLCSQLARKYLSEQRLTVKQVAFLLGYSDQSAFGVAFRRWTGQTPREARRLSS
jgi:AraC-like DNA-binding protein